MYCKYCGTPLEDGSTICPGCGKDNSQEETPLASQTPETTEAPETTEVPETTEMQPGIHFTPGKAVLAVVAVVVLIAVVVALIAQGLGLSFGGQTQGETAGADPTTQATQAAEATIPADGDPLTVACKGSYTVADDQVLAAKDDVVAVMDGKELTNGQLQIYYWLYVQQFYSSYYYYSSYFGIDFSQPLDTQICYLGEEEMTWQQFFLAGALDTWQNYQALAIAFENAGMELDEEFQTHLDTMAESLETTAQLQGFETVAELLEYNFGVGCDIDDYIAYMDTYYRGYVYFNSEYEKLTPTEDEIEDYFADYEAEYAANGITWDSKTVDVRHILILPEGATTETIDTDTFSDEAWAAAQSQAEEILAMWQAGEATEDSFAELANTYSADPGSNTNGGLYEDVSEGTMVEEFDAWCFDESRQVGDVGIVKTDLGYHVMYFSGSELLWMSYAESDLLTERSNALVAAAVEKCTTEITYSAIQLGFVDMTV